MSDLNTISAAFKLLFSGLLMIAVLWIGTCDAEAATPIRVTPKISSLDQAASPASVADSFSDPAALITEIEKKLADTREEIAAEAPKKQIIQVGTFPRSLYLQMLSHAYGLQIQRLKELQNLQQHFAEWERDAQQLKEVANISPFPFLAADQLRESLDVNAKRLTRLEQMRSQVENEAARRIKVAENSAAKLRQINEEIERSQGATKAMAIEKRAELALRHRLDWVRVVGTQIEIQRIQQEAQEIHRKREHAETQLAKLTTDARISDTDIDIVRSDIQAEKQSILAELQATMAELNSNQVAANTDNISTELLHKAQKQAAETKFQALEWMLEFLQLRQMIWEYRLGIAKANDREKAREAYEQIAFWQESTKTAHAYIELMRMAALDAASGKSVTTNWLDSIPEQDLQAVDMDKVKSLSRGLAALDVIDSLLSRCQQDFEQRFQVKTKAERWQDGLLSLQALMADIWNFELFTAEDVIDVDGQQIKGKRSITVDKVVSALLILVLGYWLAVKMAKFIEQLAVARFSIDPCLARIAKRWVLFFEVLLLAIASLMVVHIPLTVFAFMGGAVAIGAGFGMQNLLKNLISGLMLLLERPFRPGDLVEVAGVRGRITDIGVRSSHIRDANGIETLIPNSTFIEEQVTNWTLTSQSVRITVKVGVAYGSPVQQVSDILLEAAARHGLIQDKPAPQVLFEDFGSDALIFGLYVWVELTPEVDWRLVASDLRYIINKKFAAENIAIAFPQRDVRLELTQPLAVQLSDKH